MMACVIGADSLGATTRRSMPASEAVYLMNLSFGIIIGAYYVDLNIYIVKMLSRQ